MDRRSVPSPALMERAGTHAAEWIHRSIPAARAASPDPCRVLVLAGGGDNGGDARIVARCLRIWGHDVRLLETAADDRSTVLTRGHVRAEPAGPLSDDELTALLAWADVVVDGMLGTGASGPLRGEVARVARLLDAAGPAAARRPLVVALDVPTGVDADSGTAGEHAVRAAVTVAFGWPKLGCLLFPGRAHAGRVVAVEIGFPERDADAPSFGWAALDADWARATLPTRDAVTHKNAAGPVLVVAGSDGMAGAAVLAARGALRSGAGYVRVASVDANRTAVQAAVPEAVWVDREDPASLADALDRSRAVVVGPGLGTDDAAADALGRVLEADLPCVVDADALTLIASGRASIGSGGAARVLTPHPGEAARLLDVDPSEVQADRRNALERLRETFGAVILLKGRPSLVAGASRRLDPTGSSDLATAGVGDVLAGTIGAQLARGVPAEDAACLGLWLTSAAARIAGRGAGLQSADLPDHLPAALATTRAGRAPGTGEGSPPWVSCDLPPVADGVR